ncbi:MAG: transcriptional regulator [Epulopiscium sp. Nele67-Bin004]|nr:MAG: transcriptional regulator [Epulopiscium sp. Nele67-Bin004]
MTRLNDYLSEQLQEEEFKIEYEQLSPEYEIIRAIIQARTEQDLTQKQLSEKTGIQQSHISRLESGNYNPTIKFLQRIAEGLGKELHIEFR